VDGYWFGYRRAGDGANDRQADGAGRLPGEAARLLRRRRGLFLQVSAGGAKSWVFRFKVDGKLREMGLGPTHTIRLTEAREKALGCRKARLDCRKARLDGKDPIADRKVARSAARLEAAKAMTFKDCAERYIAAHKAGWKNPKHAAQWPSTLTTYVYPVMGSLPAQSVDVGLVMKALEPIWTKKPETAGRIRGRIESVLDYATARGWRTGENPARWRGHLENLLPKKAKIRRVEHHAALPYAEIAGFMMALRQQEGIAARALEFAIDGGEDGRGHRRPVGGNQRCREAVDDPGRPHEGRQGISRPAVGASARGPR
jgi:Phage integrase central domain/Arm DNA-binding domain